MRVLLINPPDDLQAMIGEGKNLLPRFEPLGLLYLAAVLRDNNYDVKVIDADASSMSIDELKIAIRGINPHIIGITTFTANGGIVYELGKWIKMALPESLVVFGNVHAAIYDKQYLKNGCCDVVVHGEGEEAIVHIAKIFAKGSRNFGDIPNVSFVLNNEYIPNREWGKVGDLAKLPPPARDLVPGKDYFVPKVNHSLYAGKVVKHMFTSRGCPNRCSFCLVHNGQKQRFNEVSRVVDEIEKLMEDYGADYIFFMDSLFISNKNRVLDLCAEIVKRKINISWGCEAHVRYIDRELVRAMANAGCHDMAFGIESGVQRLLKIINKNTTLNQISKAIRTVKNHSNILVSGLFILGLPEETYKESLQTIKFAKSLPLDMAQFSILTPYPGCKIYNDLAEEKQIDTGIRENDTLDVSVWQRYSAYISFANKEPIWVTPSLTTKQLTYLQKKAVRSFYFRPKYIWDQVKRLRIGDIPQVVKTAWEVFI